MTDKQLVIHNEPEILGGTPRTTNPVNQFVASRLLEKRGHTVRE